MNDALQADLDHLHARHLQRRLRPPADTARLLDFASNDYLGLRRHPAVTAAARRALDLHGAGAGASRLISGNLPPHEDLERAIAAFKHLPAALAHTSGYTAALGAIPALLRGPQDVAILDKLAHASLVDAARLSRATLRVFPHNSLPHLRQRLEWARARHPHARILIITESVFSMDGDTCPLPDIVALKDEFNAWLLLDEAHATGVLGPAGRGLAAHHNLTHRVEIHLGTLSKALGASGGYIAGSQTLIDYLTATSRALIYTTAPPPPAAAAATEALRLTADPDQGDPLRHRLQTNLTRLARQLPQHITPGHQTPICPIILGSETTALAAAETLRQAGILIPAIRFPTVPKGAARLRLTLSAAHTDEQIDHLATHIARLPSPTPA